MAQKPTKPAPSPQSSLGDSEPKLNVGKPFGKSYQPLIPSKNYKLGTVYQNTITVYMAVLEKAYDNLVQTGEFPPKDVLAAIQAVLNPFLKEKVERGAKKTTDNETPQDVDVELISKKLKSLDAH